MDVVVDVVVDVDVDVDVGVDPSRTLEGAHTGSAVFAAETAVRTTGCQRVAGGVHDQVHVHDHDHVHVVVCEGQSVPSTAFLHKL
ncbi:MAG: hypothetical protein MUF10_18665 [Thermoanaerobaculaceae bacterium]|nr:hypothetical protein [Thermoanaerobaculaceae bacterium]